MNAKQIKVGHWYETNSGYGKVTMARATKPPTFFVNIVGPIPRGKCCIAARAFINETTDPATWPKHQ
jgi:hypothetical protein